ncbi:MAG: M14 family metallopeptidase [Pseudomonadota bacterium]
MKYRLILMLTIAAWLTHNPFVLAQEPPHTDPFAIGIGETHHFSLPIDASERAPATHIPLSVIRGTENGPTALMVAGVHGYEFAPIIAADRLIERLAPSTLRGTLIIVRVANIPAFENRSPYVNPFDRKNLNRSFPGTPDGTQTERIAYALSSQVIPRADFVFDVHSGDGAEWLEAFIGVYGGPLASDYDTALGVALAMGFPNVVRYKMNTQAQVDRRRSLNRQAVAQGLPTVLVEVGQNGSRREQDVNLIVDGLSRALAFLGMLEPLPAKDNVKPRLFDGTQSVPVNHSGLWTPTRHSGPVKKGDILGTLRDYQGKVVETVIAPASGHGIYGLAGPPIRQGDSVMTIAAPVESLSD